MEKLTLNEFTDSTINEIKEKINLLIEEINILKGEE
jgi:uncharacterized small protein (DUF1192 family)